MATDKSVDYERAVQLAEAGEHTEALQLIQQHLRGRPDDAEALNDAAAILHCMGRSNEAMDYLLKAEVLKPGCAEIISNLAEVSIAAGRADQVLSLLDQMNQMQILNPELLNRTANLFLQQSNKAGAVEVLLRSLQLWPQQEILRHMLAVIKSKRPKIAFFCGADGMTFLEPVCAFLEPRFETRIFEGRTEDQMYELMQASDICWFEWCTDLAAAGSKLPKTSKNIIRLHRYEAYTNWPRQVNWQNIDLLITPGNSFVKDALLNSVSEVLSQTSVVTIPNGVDLQKMRFVNRPRGKNIAFLANLRMVKNPAFVLQCMQKLHYIDPEYRLFFAGTFQDLALEQYLRHMAGALQLKEVVSFDGWQQNTSNWLRDKHYVVSTSIIESQGMGILECMAAGLKPVIHNFPGAAEIYPREFLFNISEQFCEQILSDSYEPAAYRKYVEDNYSQETQLKRISNLLIGLETEIDAQPAQIVADTCMAERSELT